MNKFQIKVYESIKNRTIELPRNSGINAYYEWLEQVNSYLKKLC